MSTSTSAAFSMCSNMTTITSASNHSLSETFSICPQQLVRDDYDCNDSTSSSSSYESDCDVQSFALDHKSDHASTTRCCSSSTSTSFVAGMGYVPASSPSSKRISTKSNSNRRNLKKQSSRTRTRQSTPKESQVASFFF